MLRVRVPRIAINYTLVAESGTFSYSGNNANLLYNRTIVAETDTFSYSGNNANLFYNRKIIADNGTYAYSANNASLLYTVSGQCPTAQEIADAVWNYPLGDGYTAGEMMRVFAAVLAGKVSGAGTGTETFKSINDSKNRLVSVVDSNGNRTNITIDAT